MKKLQLKALALGAEVLTPEQLKKINGGSTSSDVCRKRNETCGQSDGGSVCCTDCTCSVFFPLPTIPWRCIGTCA